MGNIEKYGESTFEQYKNINEYEQEFWYARDLQQILQYTQWRNFLNVIEKAKISCESRGNIVSDHFADVSKMVRLGSGAEREIEDIILSRYACYLVVQNADPSKEIVALGHMGSTELAANLFRATQTDEKLRRENTPSKSEANKTHFDVGAKVRQTIEELGGTMPENLPTPSKSIQQIEKQQLKELEMKKKLLEDKW